MSVPGWATETSHGFPQRQIHDRKIQGSQIITRWRTPGNTLGFTSPFGLDKWYWFHSPDEWCWFEITQYEESESSKFNPSKICGRYDHIRSHLNERKIRTSWGWAGPSSAIIECALPVWHSSITKLENTDIERVKKVALHVILGMNYITYPLALDLKP